MLLILANQKSNQKTDCNKTIKQFEDKIPFKISF